MFPRRLFPSRLFAPRLFPTRTGVVRHGGFRGAGKYHGVLMAMAMQEALDASVLDHFKTRAEGLLAEIAERQLSNAASEVARRQLLLTTATYSVVLAEI